MKKCKLLLSTLSQFPLFFITSSQSQMFPSRLGTHNNYKISYPVTIRTSEFPKSTKNICISATSHTENLVGVQYFLTFSFCIGINSVIIPRHHIPFSILLTNTVAPNEGDKSYQCLWRNT